MTEATTQIKRLRTYSDDVASIRGVKPVPVSTTPTIKTPVERLSLTKSSPAITLMPPANVKPVVIKKTEPVVIKKLDTPPPPTVAPQPIITAIPKTPVVVKEVSQKISSPAKNTTAVKPQVSELQNEISLLNKKQPASILTASNNQLNADEGDGGGSIVTDRKKDTFNLFTASWTALGAWLDKKLRIFEPEKSTKGPTVRPVESRREVITKAASQGNIAPRGDKTTVTPVKPAIPSVEETSSSPVITIKKAEAVPPSSWSHYKDNEGAEKIVTAEADKIAPVITPEISTTAKGAVASVPEVKTPVKEAVVAEPISATPIIPNPETSKADAAATPARETSARILEQTPVSIPTQVYKKAEETKAPETTPPQPVSTTLTPKEPAEASKETPVISVPLQSYSKPETTKIPETPPPQPIAVPTYVPDTIVEQEREPEKELAAEAPAVITKAPQKTVRFATPKPSPFPIIRVSIIAVTSIVFGVSLALWLFGGNTEPNQPVAGSNTESVALVAPDQKTDVPVTNNRDSFLESIAKASVSSGSSVTLLQPKMNVNGTNTVPPAATILEILSPRWPGSFARAVEEINFGKLNGKSFMVMKVTSFEVGFSGLLASEATLISDFEPLFGAPVTGTFDLSARTVGNIVEPYFVDSSVKNHDVRILRDELQKERLVYGFINRDTIVIAPDSATFEAVADKIK